MLIHKKHNSGFLIKGVRGTSKTEGKNKKTGSLSMFLGKLDASLLGNLLTGKVVKARIPWWRVIKTGERTIREDHYFQCSLIL